MHKSSLLMLPLLLNACAVGPDFKMPSLDLPESWSGKTPAPAPAVAPQATASETIIPREWWKAFNDPALTGLIEEGLTANADLAIAAARVSEARANLRVSQADLYPQIDIQGNGTRIKPSAESLGFNVGKPRNDFGISAVLNYEIDLWGRIRRSNESARATLLSNQANRDAIRLAVASDIASGYFNMLAIDAQIEVTKKTIGSRSATNEYETKRYNHGAINALNFHQAEAELAAAKAALPALEQSRTEQENALAILLGRSPRDIIEKKIGRGTTLANIPVPPPLPADLPSNLLQRRPDIVAAEQDMVAANAAIGVATANYFPTISLGGVFGLQSLKSENLFQGSARTWQMSANLLGPLFDGGRTSANVDAATARSETARANYAQVVRSAFSEVANNLSAVSTTEARVTAQNEQIKARSDAAKIANKRYSAGYSDQLELLDTERNLYQSQLDGITALRDRLTASITLYKALGGGWNIADTTTPPSPAPANTAPAATR